MATIVAGLTGTSATARVARSTRTFRGRSHRRPTAAGLHARRDDEKAHLATVGPVVPTLVSPTVHNARSHAPRRSAVITHAAAEGVHNEDTREDTMKTARVSSFIFVWYFLNAIFAIINKRTLSVFPYPWLLSWVQIAVGAVFMLVMWKLRIFKPPEGGFTKDMFKALIPTSFYHMVAHVSACASYKFGSVSFMQVVKAGEPAIAVVLLSLFFGRKYSWKVWLTLIPIVGGVAIGSTTEINFSMAAFLCAMTSNVTSALRAATSKDLQADTGLKGINLYGGIAIVSGIMLLPLSLLVEGSQMGAAFAAAPALMSAKGTLLFGIWNAGFMAYLIIGSMFYHLYNQTAYQALGELTPLSHSVANTVKRVVIILASVAVFKNPITPVGQASAAVAILGTFIYSIVSQKDKEEAAKLAAKAE